MAKVRSKIVVENLAISGKFGIKASLWMSREMFDKSNIKSDFELKANEYSTFYCI